MPVVRTTNRIVSSRHYAQILHEYNERFERDGKVNASKFYNEIIKDLIPNYSLQAWCRFIKRFKTMTGLATANAILLNKEHTTPTIEENKLGTNMLTSAKATQLALQQALNIGLERLAELKEDPSKLSFKDAVDLIFKAMKAQDSRARVIKEIREDNREEEKFNKMLNEGAYNS